MDYPLRVKYFSTLIKTVPRLGIGNVIRVAIYRLKLNIGYFKIRLPVRPALGRPFFGAVESGLDEDLDTQTCSVNYFSFHSIDVGARPNWFANPWRPNVTFDTAAHWSAIPNFSTVVGDIKTVWELSRFDWAPQFAWQASQANDPSPHLTRLDRWLGDWTLRNPPNRGVNWKCGQEASLRVLNLMVAIRILEKTAEANRANVFDFFAAHINRIAPTTAYAKAQDNNHGTSEAAALFCIGCLLKYNGNQEQSTLGANVMGSGRTFLENRVATLVLDDGSFSQQSITYHRLMLDTLVLTELFRLQSDEPEFSHNFYEKARAATFWLHAMVDGTSGDAANMGANDGTYFINIEQHPYRDFRPTLKRALNVFAGINPATPSSDALLDAYRFDYCNNEPPESPESQFFPDGGYARLNVPHSDSHLIFRFPRYPFRPAHCDANHVDLWVSGTNITLDAGSFGYNPDKTEPKTQFAGTAAHCTMQFDSREQMPAIGRMLRGEWLKPEQMEFKTEPPSLASKYIDYLGAWHERVISVIERTIIITDAFGGFENNAVVRWRLPDTEWHYQNGLVSSPLLSLEITSATAHSVEWTRDSNSLYYLEMHEIPVLEACFTEPATVETRIVIN